MALQGRFVINNESVSQLIMYGVGSFSAYSGSGEFRNQTGCIDVPKAGPLPPGRYHIVDRPTGGWKGVIRTDLHDFYSWVTSYPVIKGEWFALYRDDGTIDDYTFINGVRRGNFRLHPRGPMGVSEGCITFLNRSDFLQVRQVLLATSPVMLRNGLRSYGTIEVVANGSKACPGRI
ncbi:DUF2778 domain-containing protein [Erwinia psidii]|uniref:DUF2778 domain-containing protein n=1 Tax=Erwinia psidii TaxID=69224 RepID=UPI00226B339E|nr:DUF2778 domain-containing protein [Erwinia psidii]MCX8957205.1 DUF2778 domain-containing protein [Erwinia psidii]